MRYKLISVNNESSYGLKCIGEVSRFTFEGGTFYFSHMRSSRVKSIIVKEDSMEVQTLNSLYIFKEEQI